MAPEGIWSGSSALAMFLSCIRERDKRLRQLVEQHEASSLSFCAPLFYLISLLVGILGDNFSLSACVVISDVSLCL